MIKLLIILGISLPAIANSTTVEELNTKLEILTDEVVSLKESASVSKTNFGGYGEFVYINKRSRDEKNNTVANATNPKLDAQRFILYIGHDFSKKWKLTSEIEVEHADEIYLEQGTLDYLHSDQFNFQAGVMLIPVGIINLEHEPTTFLSVNRPDIASKIIPTTWRELGVSVFGKHNSFSYRVSLVDGLLASGFSSDGVRSGRQKASKAEGRDLAWVTRLGYDFNGVAKLGASAYFGKAGGVATDVDHKVYDIHFDTKYKGLQFRGLYTQLKLGNTDKLNTELSKTGSNSVASQMSGYYLTLGYNVLHYVTDWSLIPFVRYENYNTQDKIGTGFTKDLSKERTNLTYGLSVKPLENIVFKLDYITAKNKDKSGVDSWNLGMGWNF